MSFRAEIRKPFKALSRSVRNTLHTLRANSLRSNRPAEYGRYLQQQLQRSLLKFHSQAPFQGSLLVEAMDQFAKHRHGVLCIGCRSTQELELFERCGFGGVVGADLFSSDPRIRVMDFHHLEFEDHAFDVVFSSHSLEHSMYPELAAAEFTRVCRPGGWIGIEVPVQFQVTDVDLQDYQSVEGLTNYFASCARIVWSETVLAGTDRNGHGHTIVRVILQK